MRVHTCDLGIWKAEAGGLLRAEASLSHIVSSRPVSSETKTLSQMQANKIQSNKEALYGQPNKSTTLSKGKK